jgi:hypothetical protein
MPIEFACPCGYTLRAPDRFAGKLARCPSCRKPVRVPGSQNGDGGLELVADEDDPHPARGKPGREVAGEDPPARRRPAAEAPPERGNAAGDEVRERPRRRRKRKSSDATEDKAAALLYLGKSAGELLADLEHERERKQGGGELGRLLASGVTLFGVHITGGVILGTLLLIIGLVNLAAVGIASSQGRVVNSRMLIGALVCTAIGVFALVRSLLFGQED